MASSFGACVKSKNKCEVFKEHDLVDSNTHFPLLLHTDPILSDTVKHRLIETPIISS